MGNSHSPGGCGGRQSSASGDIGEYGPSRYSSASGMREECQQDRHRVCGEQWESPHIDDSEGGNVWGDDPIDDFLNDNNDDSIKVPK